MPACPFAAERCNVCLIVGDLLRYFRTRNGLGSNSQIRYHALVAEGCGGQNIHWLAQILHELIAVGTCVIEILVKTLSAFPRFKIQEVEVWRPEYGQWGKGGQHQRECVIRSQYQWPGIGRFTSLCDQSISVG